MRQSKNMKTADSDLSFLTHDDGNAQIFPAPLCFEDNRLLLLNKKIDDLKWPHEINELVIEGLLEELEDSNVYERPVYWLVTARLFEMAILCAGHYADNCEFSAAGDLLVNPRKVLIYQKSAQEPLIKQRHGRLSEQLYKNEKNRKEFIQDLKREVSIEIVKPAMLQYLFEKMQKSRMISHSYLHNAGKRMKNVADTIGFLSAWSIGKFEDFYKRMQEASPEMNRFISDHLCLFDTDFFERIGQEINNLVKNPQEHVNFSPTTK
jgi:hypothetical protein